MPKKYTIKLIKYLKMDNASYYKIAIPRTMVNELNILVEMCAINGVHLTKCFTFIFGMGYELFSNFYHRGNIKNITEMLTCVKYMRNMFEEIMSYQGKEWFMNSASYMVIHNKCLEYKLNPEDIFKFIDENRTVMFGNNLLMTPEKAEAIITVYRKRQK